MNVADAHSRGVSTKEVDVGSDEIIRQLLLK
jgi:hypothetical protein